MEKNCQKRRQPLMTDSVIGKLMGFDELPHQRPLQKYRRVLSDDYIRKSASIGLRQGSLVFIGRSRDTNKEILQRGKSASEVQICRDKNHLVSENYTHSGTVKTIIRDQKPAVSSLSKPTSRAIHQESKASVRTSDHRASGNVLRYLQQLQNDSFTDQLHGFGTSYPNNFYTVQSDMTNKPCFSSVHVRDFKPKLERGMDYYGVIEMDLLSRSENRKPESGNRCGFTYKELYDNHIVPPRHSFTAYIRAMNRTSKQQRCRRNSHNLSWPASKDKNHLINKSQTLLPSRSGVYCCKRYNGPHLSLAKSSLGQETLTKSPERWKMGKEIEKVEVSQTAESHVIMEAFTEMGSIPKSVGLEFCRNGSCSQFCKHSSNMGSSSPPGFCHIKVREDEHNGISPVSVSETVKESVLCLSNSKQDKTTRNSGKTDEGQYILRSRCGSVCEQLSSLHMNPSMSQCETGVEVSSCYLSEKGSETISPVAYNKKIKDDIEIGSENDRCREMELGPDDAVADAETFCGGVFYKFDGNHLPESNVGVFSVEDGYFSYAEGASSGRASISEFSDDEGSGYSNCSRLGPPEVQKYLIGLIGRCSPDSVLESFDTQHPSTFECFESTGLQSQFQVLNSEAEEAYSEGSEMAVSSSEEEKVEGIVNLSYYRGKVHRWLGDEESRNFCYIMEVLDEAGCLNERSIMNTIKSRDCLEPPINPSVFEALEKKYAGETCWGKSDRRLLFDLTNSGLMSILNQLVNFHAFTASPLRRCFISGMKHDEVEDKLWKMLITHERGKNRDLSEKAVEGATKWWEDDYEDITFICRELEISLFEELLMEITSL